MSRSRHLGWNQCSHGLTSRPLESCHHQCLQAVCLVLGYPRGSALELLDGALKLRHCANLFTMRFPPWSSPRVGNGGGKRQVITTGLPSESSGNMGKKGSGLPGRHVQVLFFITIRILGIQRRGDGKDCAPPSSEGVGRGALQSFFLDLGLGEFCTRGSLEPAFGGKNRHRGISGWSVQPKGAGALALVRFN